MDLLVKAFFFFVSILIATGIVVGAAWIFSLPIGWLFGFGVFQSMIVAFGSLFIVSVLFLAAVTQDAINMPRFLHDAIEQADLDEEGDDDVRRKWFQPCPCESGKLFAKCCGRRAYKKELS